MQRERAFYADLLETLRRGDTEVISDSATGLLLKDRNWELYRLAATDPEEGKRLFGVLPSKPLYLVVHGTELKDYAVTHCGFSSSTECVQILYEKETLPEVTHSLTLRHPKPTDFEKVAATYHLVDREELRQDFDSPDFFGAYRSGIMVGYAGVHTDGSLGMLHVFEEYRGKGYSKEIAAFLVAHQLRLGRYPYGQVYVDNVASLALQKSIGMTLSVGTICWLARS